jgi:hypothetical protein
MTAVKLDLVIEQGATFTKSLSWYGGGKVCKPISALVPGCPTQITATAHGIPSGAQLPVFVSHVKGATGANTKPNSPVMATYVDANSVFVDTDTVGETYTANTGLLTYYAPTNLTGYTARMHIREDIADTVTILTLVSPTNITLDTALGKVTVTISATATAGLNFEQAVYDIEVVDSAGTPVVTRLAEGNVTLSREVTR